MSQFNQEMREFWRTAAKEKATWPIAFLSVLALGLAGVTMYRCSLHTPDRYGILKRNEHFYNTYENKQWRLVSFWDYSTKHPRPRYE